MMSKGKRIRQGNFWTDVILPIHERASLLPIRFVGNKVEARFNLGDVNPSSVLRIFNLYKTELPSQRVEWVDREKRELLGKLQMRMSLVYALDGCVYWKTLEISTFPFPQARMLKTVEAMPRANLPYRGFNTFVVLYIPFIPSLPLIFWCQDSLVDESTSNHLLLDGIPQDCGSATAASTIE
jgi:hypothetical protein